MIKKAHCLFEQSGTFKNEFIKLGIEAFDYDIQNLFNQTDFVCDLFKEIENCFEGKKSIFDNFSKDDLLFAFFPCTRFETQIILSFTGNASGMKKWSDKKKLLYNIKLHNELHELYLLISKLVIICIDKNLRLIIENPYNTQHYLTRYWPLKPKIIDLNRFKNGDYYEKPTQYFFINIEPQDNFFFEPLELVKKKTIVTTKRNSADNIDRSLIHPQYARRFIKTFVLKD